MEKIDLFPCPMWQFDVPVFFDLKEDLIKEIYELKHTVPSMLISNRGGWQSPDLFVMGHRSNNLKIIINKILKTITTNFFSTGYGIDIQGMWYNVNQKNSYNDWHDHAGTDIAGIFYIKVPTSTENVGNLVFFDPFNYNQSTLHEALDPKNSIRSYSVTPSEGKFLMFPAHLLHRVETNEANEDRISIAFNMKITRG